MPTQTAQQRRLEAKVAYDAYLATCPSRQLLATLSDKWVVLVLSALHDRPARYSDLRRRIAGVSQKMLTQTLRGLERDGLVRRTVVATVPVTVTYEITFLGLSLHKVVAQLKSWAESNMQSVTIARHAYDAPEGVD
ncbi:helix-turn-helix domain-containing protein [uncultured Schumannella sp.]|uniref:winged helix-turn-helix transcriptional regulator n=1 Tax=uncultured Schumannella sp. TaxID=1195956 RepID=UPI0025E8CBC6|nr:helix-turn-helix domain-containing protein [uncultured Schumannella sp.]